MPDDASLHEHFSPDAPLEPDVLAELQSTARLHGLSAEDLFYKWESYCIRLEAEASAVTLAAVRNFKQSIQDELEKTSQARAVAAERRTGVTPRGVKAGAKGDMYNMWVLSWSGAGTKLTGVGWMGWCPGHRRRRSRAGSAVRRR